MRQPKLGTIRANGGLSLESASANSFSHFSHKEMVMKNIITMLLVLFSLVGFSAANAAVEDRSVKSITLTKVVTVVKGDTLWGIAHRELGRASEWKHICGQNILEACEMLYPGQRLRVSKKRVFTIVDGVRVVSTAKSVVKSGNSSVGSFGSKVCLESKPCTIPYFHKDAFRKSGRDPEALLASWGYDSAAAKDLVERYRSGLCEDYLVGRNEQFFRMSGQTEDLVGVMSYTGKPEKAKKCVARTGETVYIVQWCGNRAMKRPMDARPVAPPVQGVPARVAAEPPVVIQEARADSEEIPVVASQEVLPVTEEPVEAGEVIPVAKKNCNRGKELSGGIYAWQNRLAHGSGVYVEPECWNELEDHPEMAWMVGGYAAYSPGESRVSTYHWKEGRIGPAVGLQRNWLNGEGREEQWLAKFRLAYEHQKGENDLGYTVHQNNLLAGVYAEWWEYVNATDRAGLTFEAWLALRSKSTDATAQSRTTYQLLAFYDWKMSDDGRWYLRPMIGPGYTLYDHTLWGRGILEFRHTQDDGSLVAFGPYTNRLLASKVYSGGAANTIGLFARVELGGRFRKQAQAEQVQEYCRLYQIDDPALCPKAVVVAESQDRPSAVKTSAERVGEGWTIEDFSPRSDQ